MATKKEKPPARNMTAQDKKEWDDLYAYVKKEILGYNDEQNIPKNIVLKLKGLKHGKHMENNWVKDMANYSFEIILLTFKLNKSVISKALYGKTFKDEYSKMLYICAIVENNINDVYLRVNNARKSQEKTESIDTDNIEYVGAEYKRKTEDTNINKFDEMW